MLNEQTDERLLNCYYLKSLLTPLRERVLALSAGKAVVAKAEAPIERPAGFVPRFEVLCQVFNLSRLERELLLLCLGMEIDQELAGACGRLLGEGLGRGVTLALAQQVLAENCSRLLAPASALSYWRLVEAVDDRLLLQRELRIDERIFYYALGDNALAAELIPLLQPSQRAVYPLSRHVAIAQAIEQRWLTGVFPLARPLLNVYGQDELAVQNVLSLTAVGTGHYLYWLEAEYLSSELQELERLLRLLVREALLSRLVYALTVEELSESEPQRRQAALLVAARLQRFGVVVTREPLEETGRALMPIEVPDLSAAEQAEVWQALAEAEEEKEEKQEREEKEKKDLAEWLEPWAGRYPLTLRQLQELSQGLVSNAGETGQQVVQEKAANIAELWQTCSRQSRPSLGGLAQRIEPKASWEDLILPLAQQQLLQEMMVQIRQRTKVYEDWGFAAKSARGLGISALFAGISGTGKTLAAEVMAQELGVVVYQIDLSAVISKYIGETEKNLKKIFAVAENSGAILLFDEADALFGKRSQVKDSHDRHANIEVSFLLQRMEAYQGISILTTNLKSALDSAFLRRLRFVVEFPFPGLMERQAIWRQAFPAQAPRENLALEKLARLSLVGGHIRSIALTAAFMAAHQGEAVSMQHVLRATQQEYAKLGKTLNPREVSDWLAAREVCLNKAE